MRKEQEKGYRNGVLGGLSFCKIVHNQVVADIQERVIMQFDVVIKVQ